MTNRPFFSIKSHLQAIKGGKMKTMSFVIILGGILIAATVKNARLIPEPVSMMLLGAGLIGLAGFWRRKFFKKS